MDAAETARVLSAIHILKLEVTLAQMLFDTEPSAHKADPRVTDPSNCVWCAAHALLPGGKIPELGE